MRFALVLFLFSSTAAFALERACIGFDVTQTSTDGGDPLSCHCSLSAAQATAPASCGDCAAPYLTDTCLMAPTTTTRGCSTAPAVMAILPFVCALALLRRRRSV